uniref:Uncharacterized protein n=1 Tax=Clastoptera arizonana TaxID=38151 RepID=A0A1B6CP88_9HEMI
MPTMYRIYEPSRLGYYKILRSFVLLLILICFSLLIAYTERSYTFEKNSLRYFFIATGTFIMILGVDLIGKVFSREMPTVLMLIFMTVGTIMFILCGVFGCLAYAHVLEYWRDTTLLFFIIISFVVALLMAVDIYNILTNESHLLKLKVKEYAFNSVQDKLLRGDVILHLVNPQHYEISIPESPRGNKIIQQRFESRDTNLISGGSSQISKKPFTSDVRNLETSSIDGEIISLKGKFYLVKKGHNPGVVTTPSNDTEITVRPGQRRSSL